MKMDLTPETKTYMNKKIAEYENNKLAGEDERQLFQDLLDSGYIAYIPKYQDQMSRLIKTGLVISSEKTNTLN